jgi:hypothetical protein
MRALARLHVRPGALLARLFLLEARLSRWFALLGLAAVALVEGAGRRWA